ncbi:hypothetical protein ONR57_22980 [Hoyosella sp. YIM 151337]|uniref:hypothetical protein n=1 Tax=Hoyosella sp. YIM 151337 TaxID=2992742 RepID=UPI002235A5BD|nr:hypothetical protein [Hoyosella sp. YIM 151337]MCW4356175.1 hypothetical protein [Hoyosella sp. YIM 151337]
MRTYRVIDKPTIRRTKFWTGAHVHYGFWTVSVLVQFTGHPDVTMLGGEHDTWRGAISEARDLITQGTPA